MYKNDSTKPTMTESGCSFLPRALYQVLLASCDALCEIPNQLLVDGTSVQLGSAPVDCHGEGPRWQTSELKLAVRARRWGNISIQQAPLVTFTSTAHGAATCNPIMWCDDAFENVKERQVRGGLPAVHSNFESFQQIWTRAPYAPLHSKVGWQTTHWLIVSDWPTSCQM